MSLALDGVGTDVRDCKAIPTEYYQAKIAGLSYPFNADDKKRIESKAVTLASVDPNQAVAIGNIFNDEKRSADESLSFSLADDQRGLSAVRQAAMLMLTWRQLPGSILFLTQGFNPSFLDEDANLYDLIGVDGPNGKPVVENGYGIAERILLGEFKGKMSEDVDWAAIQSNVNPFLPVFGLERDLYTASYNMAHYFASIPGSTVARTRFMSPAVS